MAISSDTLGRPDTRHLEPCLAALTRQAGSSAVEIIVPYHTSTEGIADLRERYPAVRFLEAAGLRAFSARGGSREHHDELRSQGLAAARGEILALTEDHGIPIGDWCSRMVDAHRQPFAGVGGAIENAVDRPLNWAVYFCDFLRYQNPLPEGPSVRASDANVSYKRSALEAIRSVWQEAFRETDVNNALLSRGWLITLDAHAILYQHRQGLRLIPALRERFVWGRSYGGARVRLAPIRERIFRALLSPLIPLVILSRMKLMAFRKRRTLGAFVKAYPLTALLVLSWSAGEFSGYVTGRTHGSPVPAPPASARDSRVPS